MNREQAEALLVRGKEALIKPECMAYKDGGNNVKVVIGDDSGSDVVWVKVVKSDHGYYQVGDQFETRLSSLEPLITK